MDFDRSKSRAAIDRAINLAGGLTALGGQIGATKADVWAWRRRGVVPPEHAPRVEAALGGKVVCEDICPAVDWALVRKAAKEAA